MKKILFLLAVITLLSLASAYPIAMQLNGNMPFNTAVYNCSDASCSSMTFYASLSGNPNTYTINNLGSGTQYFAEYDYVSDRCYVSHSYKNWFDASTGNGPWQYTINFAKQNNCQANINSVSYAPQIYDNQTEQITASIKSPLNLNAAGPQTVPNNLQYYYSTNVSSILEIRNQTALVYTQTLSQDILWGTSRNFVFTAPLLQAGSYSITLKTNSNDCMCNNYVEQVQQGNFVVLQSQQNQTNQSQTTTQKTIKCAEAVNKISLDDFILTNAFCNRKAKIILGLINEGAKLEDVYVNFKIPELSVSLDSQRFDIAKHETKYINFEFMPEKGGVYQAIISVYYKDTNKRILQEVVIKDCKAESIESLIGEGQIIATQTTLQEQKGITGNVVAFIKTKTSSSRIWLAFLILVVIALIARAIVISRLE
jgi:hypothetical protein